MKKIYIMMILVLGLSLFGYSNEQAQANSTIFSEKIWSVEMSMEIKNTEENLSKIEIATLDGEIVEGTYQINAANKKIVEFHPLEIYAPGDYKIFVKKGFESSSGKLLEKDHTFNFKIERALMESDLYGKWVNKYENEDGMYVINTDFQKNNHANMNVKFPTGVTAYGTGIYSLKGGVMTMNIPDLKKEIKGSILYYNSNKFVVYSEDKREYSEFNK